MWRVPQQPREQKREKWSNEPKKLMISFLGAPSFNSFLFESSSFPATLRARSLFHRSFCIPGSLELSCSHVSNPGNHFVMDMKRRRDLEGFPMDP